MGLPPALLLGFLIAFLGSDEHVLHKVLLGLNVRLQDDHKLPAKSCDIHIDHMTSHMFTNYKETTARVAIKWGIQSFLLWELAACHIQLVAKPL